MKRLQDIAVYVNEKIDSSDIELADYVTIDCLLQNKNGRTIAANLPPVKCKLIKYKKDDILIANIRPYLKKIWYADKSGGASTDVLVFRAKPSIDPLYLYALFLQDSFYDYVMRATKGSKMPRGDKNHIMNYIIHPVSGTEEKRIGQIISNINTKIELNKKINRELETMAKELYDYWFVQFDFPNEQGKPYKSSGGKMVWNETLKREIPEGWEVKSVNDISVSVRGVGYNKKDEKSFKDDNVVLILRGNNIADNHIVYDDNTVYIDKSFVSPEQVIHKFDLIMTMSSGSKDHVGKSAMFLFDSPHSYGAFCNKITPDIHCEFFLENYLHSEFYKKYIYQTCSGTGINNLTNEHLSHAVFPFPTRKTLHQFNQFVKEWYNSRGLLEQENNQLSGIRNQLLPLLMNGQVRVSEGKGASVSQKDDTNRFVLWKNTYPVAARGEKNDTVLRAMYDAMDDEDK